MDSEPERVADSKLLNLDQVKKARKVLRWVLCPLLIWFAYQHLDSILLEFKSISVELMYLLPMAISVLCIFVSQAGVTKTIVWQSESKIRFLEAIQLNVMGGFWGLVLPFGSVSYKAQALKFDYSISVVKYAKLFLFSMFVSCWVSLLLLLFSVSLLPDWPYRGAFLIISIVGLAVLPFVFRMKLKGVELKAYLANQLWFWHGLGLLSYIALYYFCFKCIDLPFGILALCGWVAVQSLIFLFPLVPGNLVIMEALGAYLLVQEQLSAESIVIGIALMRLASLVGLLLLAPWAYFGKSTRN